MRTPWILGLTALLPCVAALACSAPPANQAADETIGTTAGLVVEALDSPAAPGSGEPNLFAAEDGRVYLSWIEPADDDRHAVRFAVLEGHSWSEPRTIAESNAFFVNWADFPSIIATDEGALAAHWLEKNGPGTYAYEVMISRSSDGGMTWSEPVRPHHDGTQTEHGFVSLVPEADGGFTAVWLDGREMFGYSPRDRENAVEPPSMTLRGGRFDKDGVQVSEVLLDPRICECCQTSAAYVGDTLLVVYRDRSDEEVRDIWGVRRTAEGWQEPVRLAHDDWKIFACPVNGPAVAGGEAAAAIAWFSLRGGMPEVKVAFTADGVSYTDPVLIDAGSVGVEQAERPGVDAPLGRVDVEWIGEDLAVVSWLRTHGSGAEIMLRTVDTEGSLGPQHSAAATASRRASGFPRIARDGNRLVMAWTEPGRPSTLHTAIIALPLN